MHELKRNVRFAVNPFLYVEDWGENSYCAKPAGEGLAVYLEICVALAGTVDRKTGFLVNVVEIDKRVRELVVPIFEKGIGEAFRRGKHIDYCQILKLLAAGKRLLADRFGEARLSELAVKLNPNRCLGLDFGDENMMHFSEKFEFAAMHKLWNAELSEEENLAVFGKCANPAGHGHNYVLEVTVKANAGAGFKVGEFERLVDSEFIELVDHKNLNLDVDYFSSENPTVENIAVLAWERLSGKFSNSELEQVTVWETDKTSCSYRGHN